MIPNGNYVPWFIDTDNMEVSTRVEHEPVSALSTTFEDPQWDYQEVTRLPTGDAMYRHTTGNSEPWPNNFHNVPQQSFVNSPEDASYFTEGGEYSPSSSHLDSSQQQPLVMPAIITFKQEPQTPSEDIPPPPKRRKSYTGTSASTSSPTEDYRKGHNAIEKRYRSNLNAKILSLEQCLPPSETPGDDDEVGPARKTKSAILTRAVKHIEFLQQQTRRLTLETEELNRKFSALEKIAIRDSVVEVTEVEADVEADGQEEMRGEVREGMFL